VPLAIIDVRERRLPDPLTALAYLGTTGLLALAAATGGGWPHFTRAAAGGAALAAAFLALSVASKGALGLGDVKLSASLGTALAWFGWPLLLAGVFAGFAAAAAAGLLLLAARRVSWRQRIPFGPFLIAGALGPLIASLAAR
jgi:leader peptidase (prepilin peptidase) / N-methyltransferase